MVGVAAHFIFAATNLYRGIWAEATLNAVMGAFLLGGFLVNRRLKSESRTVVVILLAVTTISVTAAFLFEQNAAQAVVLGFYILTPLALFALGPKYGLRFSILVLIVVGIIVVAPQLIGRAPFSSHFLQRFGGSFVIVTTLAWILERVRSRSWRLLFRAKEKLQEAASALNTLEGLIPICSYCKKIRRDERYWQNLETYLTHHTTARISSGYCPNCSADRKSHHEAPDETYLEAVNEISMDFDISTRIKRWTSIGFLSSGVLVLWGVAVFDGLAGNLENAALFLAVSVVFMVCITLQIRQRLHFIADNVFIGSIVILVFQQVMSGEQNYYVLFWIFVVPITANFLGGIRTGTLWSGISLILLALLFSNAFPTTTGAMNSEFKFKLTAFFAILSLLAYVMERTQECYADAVRGRLEELKQTYHSIRTLKGLVPVCASCKSIRDDAGFWTTLEEYLIENTDLKLSHGICPRCLKKQYPDIYREMREKELIVSADDVRVSNFTARPYLSSLPPSSFCEEDE